MGENILETKKIVSQFYMQASENGFDTAIVTFENTISKIDNQKKINLVQEICDTFSNSLENIKKYKITFKNDSDAMIKLENQDIYFKNFIKAFKPIAQKYGVATLNHYNFAIAAGITVLGAIAALASGVFSKKSDIPFA